MAGKSRGATWKRWDPHIHAPGTLFSDKFKGASAWEDYLTAIETSEPRVRALGVTDYYRLDLYEAVRAHKQKGRLADVELIFANVELRLDVGLPKGNAINIHLLISPEDADHVERAHEFLQGLSFGAHRCDKAGLIRLGKEHQRGLGDLTILVYGWGGASIPLAPIRMIQCSIRNSPRSFTPALEGWRRRCGSSSSQRISAIAELPVGGCSRRYIRAWERALGRGIESTLIPMRLRHG